MPGRLTTHVLDTVQGRPASGVAIILWRLGAAGEARVRVCEGRANADGRLDKPLLEGEAMVAGTYELEFALGAYFQEQRIATATPPFLDRVPVRFTIADPTAHYHVPLLASPWAYSTYRGS